MKAEIVSIGTEILLGQITDTNAAHLASQLPPLGIDLYWISQVGDNLSRIVDVLSRGWARSDLILTTGGLGPTQDDVTREAIAQLLGEEVRVDATLERDLREQFRRWGYRMPEANIKQAWLIPSSQPISNPRGTAPGWWVERDGRTLVAMPGPPSEMTRMWQKEVMPRLKERVQGVIILSKTLKTLGIGEGSVDEMLGPLLPSKNPTVAVYAKPDGIHIRITSKTPTEEEGRRLLAEMEGKVLDIMGESYWGADDDTMEEVVGNLLKERGLTLATMESCTGGLLANIITDVPGSSTYFKGSLVTYTNEMKAEYGVDPHLIEEHGAISPQVAEAMAEAARRRLQADVGIGVTGVAGPSEIEGKPVGTVHVAVVYGNKKRARDLSWPVRRPDVKRRAALAALFETQRLLQAL